MQINHKNIMEVAENLDIAFAQECKNHIDEKDLDDFLKDVEDSFDEEDDLLDFIEKKETLKNYIKMRRDNSNAIVSIVDEMYDHLVNININKKIENEFIEGVHYLDSERMALYSNLI